MAPRVAAHGRQRARAAFPPRRQRQPQRRQPRGRQVDEIVEPRRRPAEMLRNARCDGRSSNRRCWPPCRPPRPAGPRRASQNSGATTPSEKFSARLSIAARATPASSSAAGSRPTIFATARRPPVEPLGVERVGDGLDVLVEAALREQRRSQRREGEQAQPRAAQHVLQRPAPAAPRRPAGSAASRRPARRRRIGPPTLSRVSKRRQISAPIQVTGWPMRS